MQVLCEDHQLHDLGPAKVLISVPIKDTKIDEALEDRCLATLSYGDHALTGTLPRDAITEDQETLVFSLHRSLRHSADLAAKSAGNVVLQRRDHLLEQKKQVSSAHLKGIPLSDGTSFMIHCWMQ
jgi:hypothetical protein